MRPSYTAAGLGYISGMLVPPRPDLTVSAAMQQGGGTILEECICRIGVFV